MNKKKITLKGFARLRCLRADGSVKWDTGFMQNTITNAGLGIVSGLIGNTGSEVAFNYLAVGTSSTAESAAHTALQAEIVDSGLARASATMSQVTTTQTDDTLQAYKEWTVTGTKSVEEVGLFNDASAGTMLGRKLTGTKSVVNGEKLQATYQIVIS